MAEACPTNTSTGTRLPSKALWPPGGCQGSRRLLICVVMFVVTDLCSLRNSYCEEGGEEVNRRPKVNELWHAELKEDFEAPCCWCCINVTMLHQHIRVYILLPVRGGAVSYPAVESSYGSLKIELGMSRSTSLAKLVLKLVELGMIWSTSWVRAPPRPKRMRVTLIWESTLVGRYLACQPIAVGVWVCVWMGEWEASIVQCFG